MVAVPAGDVEKGKKVTNKEQTFILKYFQ